jgi:rhodanese-related sulfurtransferase
MELAKLHHAGAALDVIDVRTPAEFAEVHLACARNVPLDRLNPAALPARTGSGPLYLICRSGGRGKQACQKLIDAGIADVVNVEGGTQACLATDLPVIRGAATMSLERQVRIAAGSLVVLGVVLGWQVHPALYGLSAFIGAGLVFAGITDTCGMGMLLARAPWNQRPASSCAMK